MVYRILHFADLHLDASFAGQGFPVEYGIERRLGLRATFTSLLALAREYKVDAVTIGGDLFVQEYLSPETVHFIQQQLTSLAPIRVIISPGEHDPYANVSPYARLNWPDHVDIFYQSKLTRLELAEGISLWGASNPPARGQKVLDHVQLGAGINLLLLHASRSRQGSSIHTISSESVQKCGFQLALLGGEHGGEAWKERPLCIVPGSPEPLTPGEETALHRAVLVEIDGQHVQATPIGNPRWHYRTVHVDITSCISNSEAARRIATSLESETAKTPQAAVTVVLEGWPHFDLNISELRGLIQSAAFFRLDCHLQSGYDLEKLVQERTVRGLFVQRSLEKINNTRDESERQRLLTALHFALKALEGKQVSLYEVKEN